VEADQQKTLEAMIAQTPPVPGCKLREPLHRVARVGSVFEAVRHQAAG
jgi:hypothetical protein